MKDKKFILELSENQLRLIKDALEEYFRIRMNQWSDLANDLASTGVDFSRENPDHDKIFECFIEKRRCIECVLESVWKMLWGFQGAPRTPEQLIAQDIWQVIRYTLWNENHKPGDDDWCVDSRKPMNLSGEPLPKCRRMEQ